jgi:succinylglutamic semialdehyde dehydrogenase
MISREIGKPLWESKQEVATMINKVDVTIQEGLKNVQDYEIPSILENTRGVCRYKPHGVFVVLGPFNFPGHLANGHFVPALLTGNTVVFKPSEKSPLVGQVIAQAFHEAGFPSGVFNLVQGEKEVGRRLSSHEDTNGVLFTGSFEVGLKIRQDTLLHPNKVVALEMGGKNAAVVFNDANLDWSIYETLTGAFITTGQRCSATSRILVQQKIFDEFVEKFHQRAKSFKIGNPFETDAPFMGPLIDKNAVEKYLKFLGIAQREGCEMVMRGKEFEASSQGFYVTPSVCVYEKPSITQMKKSVYFQNEIFGPNVVIVPFEDEKEAIDYTNASNFGLVASVFTGDREKYETVADELEVGLVNWNRSTVGASSRLPFGGLKRSGNHFPTAISASNYCMYPLASLEIPEPKMTSIPMKGLNWN